MFRIQLKAIAIFILISMFLSSLLQVVPVQSGSNLKDINRVCWNSDGSRLIAGNYDGTVTILDSTGTMLSNISIEGAFPLVWFLSCHPTDPDKVFVSTSSSTNSVIAMVDISTGLVTTGVPATSLHRIDGLSWDPTSNLIALTGLQRKLGGEDYWVEVWDITNNQLVTSFEESAIYTAWTSTGSQLVSVVYASQEVIIRDTATWNTDTVFAVEHTGTSRFALAPDDSTLAIALNIEQYDQIPSHSSRINLWNLSTESLDLSVAVDIQIQDISWSPDGRYIAIADSGKLYVLDTITEELLDVGIDPALYVSLVDWKPDGSEVAYISSSGESDIHFVNPISEPLVCDHDIPVADIATLIATIATANGSGNPTTICLASDSTYTFTSIHNNLNALPRITGDITIEGQNATITRSGVTNFRFFEVEPGGQLTLNDLTLSNGDVGDERGGALLNDGDLTLNSVTFDGNSATSGGAIDSESGTATITDSTFTNNTGVYGGAIDNDDPAIMTISGSTFTNNHALADAGAIHNDGATLTVSDTTFTTNIADDYGGAIDNDDGELTVNASTFTSNSSDGGGAIRNDGTLTINAGSVFTTNAANNLGWGGAIYNKSDSTVVINASSFSGNTANLEGGAIRNSGALTVNTGSTFDSNTAVQYGGAIYNTSASATLTGVEITDNTATTYDAGGVYGNSSTSITITDSTLSGNDSGRRGGGIWSSGTTSLTNVYLTNNTAVVEGGGIYGSSSATISAGNSCISGNSSRAAYSASSTNQNFENNWWGATDGPSGSGSGSGDAVNSKIDFTPFITTGCPLP